MLLSIYQFMVLFLKYRFNDVIVILSNKIM